MAGGRVDRKSRLNVSLVWQLSQVQVIPPIPISTREMLQKCSRQGQLYSTSKSLSSSHVSLHTGAPSSPLLPLPICALLASASVRCGSSSSGERGGGLDQQLAVATVCSPAGEKKQNWVKMKMWRDVTCDSVKAVKDARGRLQDWAEKRGGEKILLQIDLMGGHFWWQLLCTGRWSPTACSIPIFHPEKGSRSFLIELRSRHTWPNALHLVASTTVF